MNQRKRPVQHSYFTTIVRALLVIAVPVVILMLPVLFLLRLFWWDGFYFRLSLPFYPGTQQVNYAYGYYGADTGKEVLYFWTPDTLKTVQAYYEPFAFPFRENKFNGGVISLFGVHDTDLIYYDIEVKPHRTADMAEPYCQYTQTYHCVNVLLIPVDAKNKLSLMPDLIGIPYSRSQNATPSPLDAPLATGTLIIYSYFVSDW